MIEQFNRSSNSVIPEGVDLKSLEFKALKEFIGEEVVINGYYFHTGNYGKQVTLYASKTAKYPNGVKINVPKRYTETFENMEKAENYAEIKTAILTGHVKLVNINEYKSKNGNTVGFELADC